MEYIDGVDLKNYIKMKGGRLTPEEVVYIITKVSGALKAIHNLNVLHRDISPDNILPLKFFGFVFLRILLRNVSD